MRRETLWRWAPAVVLLIGTGFTIGRQAPKQMALRSDLAEAVPAELDGFVSRDIELSDREVRVAGVSSYLMREFHAAGVSDPAFSLYVGYYDSQTQGKTIHSPKNCLPGAGWEALESQQIVLDTPAGAIPANRYVLQRDEQRALVVYWYQGRGRVEANEYRVKAQLLRDAALFGRSEEALVRIVVPVTGTVEDAFTRASAVATQIVTDVASALPAWES